MKQKYVLFFKGLTDVKRFGFAYHYINKIVFFRKDTTVYINY